MYNSEEFLRIGFHFHKNYQSNDELREMINATKCVIKYFKGRGDKYFADHMDVETPETEVGQAKETILSQIIRHGEIISFEPKEEA